jgi:hypothetical protein
MKTAPLRRQCDAEDQRGNEMVFGNTAAHGKAILLGSVTTRFPELRFAFLEGGVGWASQLFGDPIEHWERRSAKALERMRREHRDFSACKHPDKLDCAKLMSLVEKYGYDVAGQIGLFGVGQTTACAQGGGDVDHPQGGLGRSLRQALLLRLRGGRPDERHRVWPQ